MPGTSRGASSAASRSTSKRASAAKPKRLAPAELASVFQHRVGFLGCPPYPGVEWNESNVARLEDLGFNTVQLNIAWGYRPGGEALNLEDVIDVPPHLASSVKMLGDQSPERREKRRADLHDRARLAGRLGMRRIFHFGAPYVGDAYIGDAPENCLLDGKTTERCLYILDEFGRQYPEVDDILIYTYDQHAWLCSEFGPCPRCTGIPVVERALPFLEKMGRTWRKTHPKGRLWWEPWELSAGQVQQCIERVDPEGFGFALHCTIAEVIATYPGDRWLKNCCFLASERSIPVIVEYWLGGPSEEVEPYLHLSYPLVTLRGLRAIADVPGASGIKEYFGLIPDKEDPNLRMTGLFFADPDIGEDEALSRLARPYGEASADMVEFWKLSSSAVELFPWDVSWLIREIGKSDPVHAMTAACIHGVPWHTPSWASTRRAIYMQVDTVEVDAWMLEDVQLRCELAAGRMESALEAAKKAKKKLPAAYVESFAKNCEELREMRRRTLAYVYHIRETNLAATMRVLRAADRSIPERTLKELLSVLKADQANQGETDPIESAISLLRRDVGAFLDTYFTVVPDRHSKGNFSLTSR